MAVGHGASWGRLHPRQACCRLFEGSIFEAVSRGFYGHARLDIPRKPLADLLRAMQAEDAARRPDASRFTEMGIAPGQVVGPPWPHRQGRTRRYADKPPSASPAPTRTRARNELANCSARRGPRSIRCAPCCATAELVGIGTRARAYLGRTPPGCGHPRRRPAIGLGHLAAKALAHLRVGTETSQARPALHRTPAAGEMSLRRRR